MDADMSPADLLNAHADARPATAESLSDCEDAAKLIGELHAKLAKWDADELQDCLHMLDEAAAEARAAANRVHDALPHGSEY